jgi:hypothetical protein
MSAEAKTEAVVMRIIDFSSDSSWLVDVEVKANEPAGESYHSEP